MSPTNKLRQQQPQGLLPASIEEQYKDGRYSDFVESSETQDFYRNYLHHSFFQALQEYQDEEEQPLSKVLDLGCGNAILSRKIWKLRQQQQQQQPNHTPLTIVAMDKMDSMLNRGRDLCKKEKIPILWKDDRGGDGGGILFRRADLLLLESSSSWTEDNNKSMPAFDLSMSGFLLAHLTTRIELETVLRVACDALRPGGLSLHIIPGTPPNNATTEQEGEAFRVELPLGDNNNNNNNNNSNNNKPIVLYDVHWNESTYVNVMERVGFVEVTIEELQFHPDTTTEWKERNGNPSGYKLLKGRKRTRMI